MKGGGFDLFGCFGECCGETRKGPQDGDVAPDIEGGTPGSEQQRQQAIVLERRLKFAIRERKEKLFKAENQRHQKQQRVDDLTAALQDSRSKRGRPKMVKDWIMAKELLQTASDKSNRLKAELREAEEQLDQVKWATGHCLDVEAMSSLAGDKEGFSGLFDRAFKREKGTPLLERACNLAGRTVHRVSRSALTLAILPFIIKDLPVPGVIRGPAIHVVDHAIRAIPAPIRSVVAEFPMLKQLLGAGRTFWEVMLLIRYRHFMSLYDDTNSVLQVLSSREDGPSSPAFSSSSSPLDPARNDSAPSPLASVASALASLRGDPGDSTFLNTVLSSAWTTIANQVQAKIQENLVQSMRREGVEGSISNIALTSIDMGTNSPRIEDLRVLQTRSPHELQVTCKLRWVSSGDAGVVLSGNVKPLPVTSHIRLHNFDVELPVWLRLRFNPSLFAAVPLTSLAFAATRRPVLSFDISIDGRRITGIFGLKELLEEALQMALKNTIVLPKKIQNQMAPDVLFHERNASVGKFVLHLHEAIDLPGADYTGLSDPYVKIVLKSEHKDALEGGPQEWRSRTVSQSCNPSWNERVELFVYDEMHDEVEIQVWDEDDWSNDDFLGKVTVKLSEFGVAASTGKGDGERTDWLELSTKGQVRCKYGYHRFVGDEPSRARGGKKKDKQTPPLKPVSVRRVSSSLSAASSSSSASVASKPSTADHASPPRALSPAVGTQSPPRFA